MSNERRNEQRVSVSLEARWLGMSGKHEARVCDINAYGCFIETIGQPALGEVVKFSARLPSGEWRDLQGEVMFCDPFIGFGVRFVNLSPEDRNSLAQFIQDPQSPREN